MKTSKDTSGQALVQPLPSDLCEPFDTPFLKLL
jgi:hypothetical protein